MSNTNQESQASLEDAKADAVRAAEELREAATQKAAELKNAALQKGQQIRDAANERADHLKDIARDGIGVTSEKLDDLKTEGEAYVRANPAKSVLIALGIGFIIGRIIR